jgi:hypothetical protein
VGKKGKNEHVYKETYRLLEIESLNEIKQNIHVFYHSFRFAQAQTGNEKICL